MVSIEKIKQSGFYQKYLLSGKLAVIGIIALLMMVPGMMLKDIMHERKNRSSQAKEEIHNMWSGKQTVVGPVLEVPYTRPDSVKSKYQTSKEDYFYVMPEQLKITGTLAPETRRRGIFETVLYEADLHLQGSFKPDVPLPQGVDANWVNWEKAKVIVSVSDARGIKEANLLVDDQEVRLEPYSRVIRGTGLRNPLFSTFSMTHNSTKEFSLKLKLKGSENVSFIPVGRKTEVNLGSSWHSPSFTGKFLPDTRSIDSEGFSALWTVTEVSHGLPKVFQWASNDFRAAEFGVKLMMPVGVYTQSLRLISYSLLFVFFIYGAVFCAERISGVSIHILQYAITGVAIMIFYVLLLSLAEQINFAIAYTISAGVILSMILGYFNAILRLKNLTLALGGMLALMYGFFYVVLQCEDYALLMGSAGLVTIVSAVMYLTRDIHKS